MKEEEVNNLGKKKNPRTQAVCNQAIPLINAMINAHNSGNDVRSHAMKLKKVLDGYKYTLNKLGLDSKIIQTFKPIYQQAFK